MEPTQPSGPWTDSRTARLVLAAILFAVLGGVLWYVTREDGSANGTGGPVALSSRPAGAPTPADDGAPGPLDGQRPIIGQPAPDFALRDVDGNLVRISDLRGRVVWVNFWATWCTPCKKELPDIQRLQDEKRDQGLTVLTVNVEESADDARAFFESRGFDMTILLDRRGKVYDQYALQGLPDSFFIDREGTLKALHWGFLDESTMRKRLAAAGLP